MGVELLWCWRGEGSQKVREKGAMGATCLRTHWRKFCPQRVPRRVSIAVSRREGAGSWPPHPPPTPTPIPWLRGCPRGQRGQGSSLAPAHTWPLLGLCCAGCPSSEASSSDPPHPHPNWVSPQEGRGGTSRPLLRHTGASNRSLLSGSDFSDPCEFTVRLWSRSVARW